MQAERSSTASLTMHKGDSVQECRACLKKLEDEVGRDLFEAWFTPWAVRGALIADDLAKFADVEITENDEFSKVICVQCYKRLSDACTFMITVQMNDSILRSRADKDSSPTAVQVGNTAWPQPILLHKSGNGVADSRMEVEVKQEVVSEEDNGAFIDQDWEPTMDIKIEPEEISAPVQSNVQVNGTFDVSNKETANTNGSGSLSQEEYLDNTIKQEPASDDDLLEEALDLPLDCMLCFKVFHSVSGLKAHVIAHHSYGGVKRKADSSPSPSKNKTSNIELTCHTCTQSFRTSTDLMVHRASHSEHVCYVCDAKFNTFRQLSRHGPRCRKKRAYPHTDTPRPQLRPQPLSVPKDNNEKLESTSKKLPTRILLRNTAREAKEAEDKCESPPIEDMVVEKVQELIKNWSSAEEMDPAPTKSEDELASIGGLVKEHRRLEVIKVKLIKEPPESKISTEEIKLEPIKIEIGPQITKQIQGLDQESKPNLLEKETKPHLVKKIPNNENKIQIKDIENVAVKLTEQRQVEQKQQPRNGGSYEENETYLSQKLHNNPNSEVDTSDISHLSKSHHQDEMSQSEDLTQKTVDKNNSVSDAIDFLQSQDLENPDVVTSNQWKNGKKPTESQNFIADQEKETSIEEKSGQEIPLINNINNDNAPKIIPNIDKQKFNLEDYSNADQDNSNEAEPAGIEEQNSNQESSLNVDIANQYNSNDSEPINVEQESHHENSSTIMGQQDNSNATELTNIDEQKSFQESLSNADQYNYNVSEPMNIDEQKSKLDTSSNAGQDNSNVTEPTDIAEESSKQEKNLDADQHKSNVPMSEPMYVDKQKSNLEVSSFGDQDYSMTEPTNIEEQTSKDNGNTTQRATDLDKVSEMKVHLAISPLREDTVLFDTEMDEGIGCANNDSCEPKLVNVISDQSDIEHS